MWTHAVFGLDYDSSGCTPVITQSHIWFYLSKNSKLLEKHQHINSQKLRTQWTTFRFKNKTQLEHVAGKWHKYNERKKWQARSGKIDSSECVFHIGFNDSYRNAKEKKQRENYWQDVSVNLSENMPTATEIMTQKFYIYLLGMSNHIFKFIFKTSQYPFVAFLCWYAYESFFLKKSMILQG